MGFVKILILTAFIGLVVTTVAAGQTANNVRFPRYDNKPVAIHIVTDKTFDKTFMSYLKAAATSWQATGDLKFDFPPPVPSCLAKQKDNTICVSNYYNETDGLAGSTYQQYLTKQGIDGKLLIQSGYMTINTYWRNLQNTFMLQEVFCHEIGHNLGLNHPEDDGTTVYQLTCMTNDPPHMSTIPSSEDYAVIQQIYSARDKR